MATDAGVQSGPHCLKEGQLCGTIYAPKLLGGEAEAESQLSSRLLSALVCFPDVLPPESFPLRNHLHKKPVSGSASRVVARTL